MNKNNLFLAVVLPLFLYLPFPLDGNSMIRKHIWLIVHGTFAKNSLWHTLKGDFHKQLAQSAQKNSKIYSGQWSGQNSDSARLQAGLECKEFIKTIANENDVLHIVGHSHGGNVAIIALNALAAECSSIKCHELITLGTPICPRTYMPNMNHIGQLYNLFSYGDRIQPVLQIFKRIYPEHPRIHNIQIQCNNLCPSHMELRYPLIAQYIPTLSDLVKGHKEPLLIHFFDKKKPSVILDANREKDLQIDKQFTEQMLTTFVESRHGSRFLNPPQATPLQLRALRFWNRWNFYTQPITHLAYPQFRLYCRHRISTIRGQNIRFFNRPWKKNN